MADSDTDSVASKIKAKQAKIELHRQRSKERADIAATTKAAYTEARESIVVLDLKEKLAQFISYHQKIAQDGVGARATGYKLENGEQEVENYFLSKDDRVSHLDKASGLQELSDYLDRQTALPLPTPNAALIEKAANDGNENPIGSHDNDDITTT